MCDEINGVSFRIIEKGKVVVWDEVWLFIVGIFLVFIYDVYDVY